MATKQICREFADNVNTTIVFYFSFHLELYSVTGTLNKFRTVCILQIMQKTDNDKSYYKNSDLEHDGSGSLGSTATSQLQGPGFKLALRLCGGSVNIHSMFAWISSGFPGFLP